jgi:hypothetical protein
MTTNVGEKTSLVPFFFFASFDRTGGGGGGTQTVKFGVPYGHNSACVVLNSAMKKVMKL